jgi:hypothetical protein
MTAVPPTPIEYQLIGIAEDGGVGDLLRGLDQKQGRVRLQAAPVHALSPMKSALKAAKSLILLWKTGAGEGIRTLDPNLGKVVLYP